MLPRNSFCDLVRIFAASCVALGHGREFLFEDIGLPFWFYRLTSLGMASVMVFFAVSGYSIASEPRYGFREFLFRRLTRLWLVLVPVLLLTLAVDTLGINIFGLDYGPQTTANHFIVSERLSVATFLGNLAFLQTLITHSFGSNTALWSLSLEFWCYIAFYFRRRLLILIPLCAALTFLYPLFPIVGGIWALGALATKIRPNRTRGAILAALFLWVLILGIDKTAGRGLSNWVHYAATGIVAAAMVGSIRFENRAITYLSGFTYTLYAIHVPLLALVNASMGNMKPEGKNFETYAVVMALIFIFCFGLSRLTEAHTRAFRELTRGAWAGLRWRLWPRPEKAQERTRTRS